MEAVTHVSSWWWSSSSSSSSYSIIYLLVVLSDAFCCVGFLFICWTCILRDKRNSLDECIYVTTFLHATYSREKKRIHSLLGIDQTFIFIRRSRWLYSTLSFAYAFCSCYWCVKGKSVCTYVPQRILEKERRLLKSTTRGEEQDPQLFQLHYKLVLHNYHIVLSYRKIWELRNNHNSQQWHPSRQNKKLQNLYKYTCLFSAAPDSHV